MNTAKRKYAKKCKSRIITFYLNETELYDFSKSINFQQFVKYFLKEAYNSGNNELIKQIFRKDK